jgi:hypothetical protein
MQATTIETTGPIPVSDMHRHTLGLHGLTSETCASAKYRTPTGEVGSIRIPAAYGFRCLGVCPAYWSNDHLANYALGNGMPAGSSVWYELVGGEVVTA